MIYFKASDGNRLRRIYVVKFIRNFHKSRQLAALVNSCGFVSIVYYQSYLHFFCIKMIIQILASFF